MNTVNMCYTRGGLLQQLNAARRSSSMVGSRAAFPLRPATSAATQKETPPTGLSGNTGAFPRKVFSGIQPTGSLHLGNYLGAVQKWTQLQKDKEDVTYCIVDMHSITLPQDPATLRENIFQMAATLLACGINPQTSTVFVQSAVKEHCDLSWILGCMTTMARLGHLPQYKEKTRQMKDIPLGLFVYPVLQAADIMLYKSTHVPVGEDQVQHIQLAQHLTRTFNGKYGETFPVCQAVIESGQAARIRSLRDPNKKMSKSDPDPKATINILDFPEVIVEKVKKAVTDFQSDVSYDPAKRMGVSNLIAIHALVTGQSIEAIVEEARSVDTGKYKLRVADAIVEHLRPIRSKVLDYMERRTDLICLLEMGADKARQVAAATMSEVRQKTGLGAQFVHPSLSPKEDASKPAKSLTDPVAVPAEQQRKTIEFRTTTSAASTRMVPSNQIYNNASTSSAKYMVVPKQEMRVEKERKGYVCANDVIVAAKKKQKKPLLHKQAVSEAATTTATAASSSEATPPVDIAAASARAASTSATASTTDLPASKQPEPQMERAEAGPELQTNAAESIFDSDLKETPQGWTQEQSKDGAGPLAEDPAKDCDKTQEEAALKRAGKQ